MKPEEYLLKCPAINKIIYPDGENVYDDQNIVKHSRMITRDIEDRLKKELIIYLAVFLDSPIIIDNFRISSARFKWKQKLKRHHPSAYSFYETNRLKLKSLSKVARLLKNPDKFGIESLHGTEELWGKIRNYENLCLEEKIKVVNQATTLCRMSYGMIAERLG